MGCIVVVLALLVCAYWLFGTRSSQPLLSALPSDTLSLFEIHDIDAFVDTFSTRDAWNPADRVRVADELRIGLFDWIDTSLGDLETAQRADLERHVVGLALAFVPVGEARNRIARVQVLRTDQPAWASRFAEEFNDANQKSDVLPDDLEEALRSLPGSPPRLVAYGPFLFAYRDTRLTRRLRLTEDAAPGDALGDMVVAPDQPRPVWGMVSPGRTDLENEITARIHTAVRRFTGMSLADHVKLSRYMRPGHRIRFTLAAPRSDLMRIELKSFKVRTTVTEDPLPADEGETGFWTILLYIVLTPIVLLIGLVVLFLLVTLSLAAYFWLVSWWRGELSPRLPAEDPSISPALQDDLAALHNRRDRSAKTDSNDADGTSAVSDESPQT